MKRKTYLIVGGTRGIGRSIAQSLAKSHQKIFVIGRQAPLYSEKVITSTSYVSCDISQPKSISTMIQRILKNHGKISHIVFCQRYRGSGDDWDGEFAVSLSATKTIIEGLSVHFDQTPERSIVIISSLASYLVGLEQPVSYHVAKAAINQLVRYFAVTLGPIGVRVNAVSPCTILKDESKTWYFNNPKLVDLYKKIIPIGRMGTAEDIADIVHFLCHPTSMFITGQNIIADGGLSLISQEALARQLL